MIPRDTKSPQQEVSESLTEQLDSAVKALVDSTPQSETVNADDMGDPSRLTEEELAELEAAKDKSKRGKRV